VNEVVGITISADGTQAVLTLDCGCEERVDADQEEALSFLHAEIPNHQCERGE